jgi:hypothetical protein
MRTTVALALVATIGLWTAPVAGTEFEKFDHHIARSATNNLGRPALGCVCQDGGEHHGQAGELFRVDEVVEFNPGAFRRAVRVFCSVPGFNDAFDGIRDVSFFCTTFAVLPR